MHMLHAKEVVDGKDSCRHMRCVDKNVFRVAVQTRGLGNQSATQGKRHVSAFQMLSATQKDLDVLNLISRRPLDNSLVDIADAIHE